MQNEGQLVMLEFEKMRMNFQMVLGLQKEVILERAQNFGVKETIATHGEVEKSVRPLNLLMGSCYAIFLIVMYNVWDLMGQNIPLIVCVKLESREGLKIAVLARFFPIPAFYFTAKYADQGRMIFLTSFWGLTNSYLTVCVLTSAPKGYKSLTQRESNVVLAGERQGVVFFLSSASAQVFADIALCPFEAVKVRVQTQPDFAKGVFDGFPKLYALEGISGCLAMIDLLCPASCMPYACLRAFVSCIGFMDPSHSSALSSVSQNSHVVSLNALTEEIVAYEKEIDDTHAVKNLDALSTPESFVTHSNFDTPGGTVYYIPKVSVAILLVKGNVYDLVNDCVVAYMKYAAEAGFVVRHSCQKRMLNGDVRQKYLVCNRMGCPKGIHVDTLDL
ncbi:protein FAR1-related sequence 5, partial [Tanacetum coccineum]